MSADPPPAPSRPTRVRDHVVWLAILAGLFALVLGVAALAPQRPPGAVPDEPWKPAGTLSGPGASLASGR